MCNTDNQCGNLTNCGEDCWCTSPDITFTKELLNKVPDDLKDKACICKACALMQN
ncbi:cysteine-rich CWC family protein [Psychrosphaera sp. 1_MG-2023]|uniref:cysteine-rich CWC family protein n=1 Tax=unclassified Psychrosphaera TaxID=2641570 RepID=UPI002090D51D|nr:MULTISPECIES: cysteine-rich CWC family protein [unclassified Psychrosphaera]MDO6720417.1 cysteine-rich CWC family protein [Psychrosphaera sp. 1_MG-2023]